MDAHHSSPSRGRQPLVSPAQVIALGLVAASIGWAAWLLRDQPIREETELLSGSVLPSSELAIMEAAFDRAQLTDYRTEGGRVYVPRSRQSAYMRALVDAEALPREFGGSLRRALANNSPWQSKAVQAELLRVATQDELSLVLCSMPGIERAAVLYDVEQQSGLAGGSVKTASVSIRTQPDSELDPARVQAIRIMVAASIAGLAPERVAVTDLRNGRVFAGPLEDSAEQAVADPALARRLAYERVLAAKVRQSISYIKGAIVDVTVEFAAPRPVAPPVAKMVAPEPPPASEPPRQKIADANAPAEVAPPRAAPPPAEPPTPEPQVAADAPALSRGDTLGAVHVSIAVPDAYLRTAAATRARDGRPPALDQAAAEADEMERLRELVAQMIPATDRPGGRRVVVTSFPTAGPTASRRDTAPPRAPVAAPPEVAPDTATTAATASRIDRHISLQEVLELLAAGDRHFDPRTLPREVWLAATSVCVGLLAGLLWWLGARNQGHRYADTLPPRISHPQIDWSRVEAPPEADTFDHRAAA
jgi:type III secretory pathway lipoprotein EscJ